MIFDSLGIGELGVVLILILLLVEPKQVGKIMKSLGKFRRKVSQVQAEFKTQLNAITLEEDAKERREKAKTEKDRLRRWGRDQARALPASTRASASQAMLVAVTEWSGYRHAKVVSCFAGTLEEPDTEGIMRRILADGKSLVVPYVLKDATTPAETATPPVAQGAPEPAGESAEVGAMRMALIRDLDADLEEGAFGILEPRADLRTGDPVPDLILVPGSCFDVRGGRLGKGLGFYDRYLAGRQGLKAGLCFDVQITQKNLTLDPHDQLMDAVVSEKRFLVLSAPRLDDGSNVNASGDLNA